MFFLQQAANRLESRLFGKKQLSQGAVYMLSFIYVAIIMVIFYFLMIIAELIGSGIIIMIFYISWSAIAFLLFKALSQRISKVS